MRRSPAARLAEVRSRLDAIDQRPRHALERLMANRAERLQQTSRRLFVARETLLRTERARIVQQQDLTRRTAERLVPGLAGVLDRKRARLTALTQLFDSLNYKSVLARGYALVWDQDGRAVTSAAAVIDGQPLALEFADGKADATAGRPLRVRPAPKPKAPVEDQGALF